MYLGDEGATDARYYFDSVALRHMDKQSVEAVVGYDNCFIPDEIGFEMRSFLKHEEAIKGNCRNISRMTLQSIVDILHNSEIDHKVLDLYSNRGNGDIILLAMALEGPEDGQYNVFDHAQKPVVVTEDNHLRTLCEQHGVEVMSTTEFLDTAIAQK